MSLHWTEDDLARCLAAGQVRVVGSGGSGVAGARAHPGATTPDIARPPLTEKAWQAAVMRLLKDAGYAYVYHTFDARRSPSGFPDIVAVHKTPGRELLCIELKTATGQVTQAQHAWLTALAECTGVVSAVWKPADLESIVQHLRGV